MKHMHEQNIVKELENYFKLLPMMKEKSWHVNFEEFLICETFLSYVELVVVAICLL